MIGLLYHKEERIEDIKDALVRYFQFNKQRGNSLIKHAMMQEESPEKERSPTKMT